MKTSRTSQQNRVQTELIINMGSRQAKLHAEDAITYIQKSNLQITRVHKLKRGKDLHRVMKRAIARQPGLIVVGGGDGTVSDVVDYLAGTTIELGIIPLGTTNNFSRSLGIPLNHRHAIDTITTKPARHVDLGSVNGDLFSNVAGVGLSAEIAQQVTDEDKRTYGRLAYAITGLKVLLRHEPFHVTLRSANNSLRLNIKTHQLIVANGRYHAGKEIARDAKPDNRELVIFKLGGTSRLSLVWHALDFYLGRRRSVSHTAYLLAKDIRLETDRPIAIELDGEVKESTPARICIKPASILVRH